MRDHAPVLALGATVFGSLTAVAAAVGGHIHGTAMAGLSWDFWRGVPIGIGLASSVALLALALRAAQAKQGR